MNEPITIKELYEWAIENKCENAEIFIPSYNTEDYSPPCPAIDWELYTDEDGPFIGLI